MRDAYEKKTYAFRNPNVQKMEKKAPATQSHPLVPPSGGNSVCFRSAGIVFSAEMLLMLVEP